MTTPEQPVECSIAKALKELADEADTDYCRALDMAQETICCGEEYKLQNGLFGQPELHAHRKQSKRMERHFAIHYAVKKIREAIAIRPKRESGWLPIETAPKDGSVFLALMRQEWDEGQLRGERQGWLHLPRHPFTCRYEAPNEDHDGYFISVDACGFDEHDCEPNFWMPLPTTTSIEGEAT